MPVSNTFVEHFSYAPFPSLSVPPEQTQTELPAREICN